MIERSSSVIRQAACPEATPYRPSDVSDYDNRSSE